MKQLEHFFLLIDQCLNDTEFIRRHALREKDFGGCLHIRVLLYKAKYHC